MSVSIWVVDDDRSIRWVLEKALGQEGYAVTCFEDADEALNTLEQGGQEPEVLISDVRMPGTDGLRMLKILQRKNPDLPVIIMTAHSDLDSAVASYQGGAFEYLPKPFDVDEAVALVRRAIKHREESRGDFPEPVEEAPTEIIGEAPAMQVYTHDAADDLLFVELRVRSYLQTQLQTYHSCSASYTRH